MSDRFENGEHGAFDERYGGAPEIPELARLCRQNTRDIVQTILPAAKFRGGEARVGGIGGETGESLSIQIRGPKAGLWKDHATGQGGDTLGLIAAVRGQGLADACKWASGHFRFIEQPLKQRGPAIRYADVARNDAELNRRKALRIFNEAIISLRGTPAEVYFDGRGIRMAEMGYQPRALRFHPGLWNGERQCPLPAVVAAVTDKHGEMIAVHRTWIEPDAEGRWRKAKLQHPKMSLGRVGGGMIRLWSGKYAGASRTIAGAGRGGLVVAEGIETALSVAFACPELRVVSAISLPNMAAVLPPADARLVIAVADNDGADTPAARAFERAVDHLASGGRRVLVARSPVGKDFNDALQGD